jgi:uncharacterized protein (TIGR02001 family)
MHGPWLRWGRGLALGVGGLLLSMGSHAQLGVSVAADSDYRFRGVSLSDSRPSLRMTLNYDAPDGWYAGASATRAALTQRHRYTQGLGYAGWVTRAVEGRSLEFGADYSYFAGNSTYDFAEAYAGLLAERWSARVYYAPNYFGRNVQTLYAELNAHFPLNERARLFGHLGLLAALRGGNDDGAKARGDGRAGAGLVLRDWDLQLAWVTASRGGPYPAVYGGRRSAWVAGATLSF